MQAYDIRRGHFENIEGEKLGSLIKEKFGKASKTDDGAIETSFGAIMKLSAKVKDKATIIVDTQMNPNVDNKVAEETRKKFYEFLEAATGYNAKERVKRLQKKAKDGKL